MTSFFITLFLGAQLLDIPENILPAWLTLYKEYPILCKGTAEGVKNNFVKYSEEPRCVILVAETDDHTMAGIATGIPLTTYTFDNATDELFHKSNLDPSDYYLINDLIIFPEYRIKGLATKLYKKLEKKAKSWGYKGVCLSTIEHRDNHPLKPSNYYDPALFWRHLGFSQTSIKVKESWPTIVDAQGKIEMYQHTLSFWIKKLP